MPRPSSYDSIPSAVPTKPPPPPTDLEPEEQAEWLAITARLPADWFTGENVPMLRELCRHICYSRELARQIAPLWKRPLDSVVVRRELSTLLRAHGFQSERIGNLSTKLRLTQQSRAMRSADKAGVAAKNAGSGRPKPWEDWRENVSDREQ